MNTSWQIDRSAPSDPEDDDMYEVVDGVRVYLPPRNVLAGVTISHLLLPIGNAADRAGLGRVCVGARFTLPLPVGRSRRPGLAFVPYSRWPKNRRVPHTAEWAVVPDLCVEVVSPTDPADELAEKVGEYFQAGVRLVWVVYPRLDTVYVFDAADRATVVGRAGTLDGGPVLPGFTLALSELFPDPAAEG